MNNMKSFQYKGKTIFYITKDIDINLRERNGIEMASCYMEVFDDNHNALDVFQVYDEKLKVLYAMPADAEMWYEDHIIKKEL